MPTNKQPGMELDVHLNNANLVDGDIFNLPSSFGFDQVDPATDTLSSDRSYRDVIYDVLNLQEGDGIREQLKTRAWLLGNKMVDSVREITTNLDRKAKTRLIGVAMIGVLSVGATADSMTLFEQGEASQANELIEEINSELVAMPKEIHISYDVPQSQPRVLDLAVAMDMDPSDAAKQVSEQLGEGYNPESNMPAGESVAIKTVGTDYFVSKEDTMASLSERFVVPPNVLRAANPELQAASADQSVSEVMPSVVIPRPLLIAQLPTKMSYQQAQEETGLTSLMESGEISSSQSEVLFDGRLLVVPVAGDAGLVSIKKSPVLVTSEADSMPAPEKAQLAISPEVQRVNEILSGIDLGSPTIDLSELTSSVIALDRAFRTIDKDRMALTPEGTVKMLLAHEAIGLEVPFTVAERTADVERYVSPEAYAVFLATAKLYQLRLADFPELSGSMLRMRDGNGPAHSTHNDGTSFDISSAFGWEVQQYADGPFGDYQFSESFHRQFNQVLLTDMAKMKIGGQNAIKRVYFSDQELVNSVNQASGYTFMKDIDENHKDHYHVTLNPAFSQPQWRPTMRDMPWDDIQDLKIGDAARPITSTQHDAEHKDFEQYVAGIIGSAVSSQEAAEGTRDETTENTNDVDPLESIVDSLDATDYQKEFLRLSTRKVIEVSAQYNLNPYAVLAQAAMESGYAESELSVKANNLFGVKIGSNWEGDHIELMVGPEDEQYPAKFRVYDSIEESIEDYAKLIDSRSWYDDAQLHSDSIELYLRGLLDELNPDGSVAKRQGEEGVLSYDFTPDYDQRVIDVINSLNIIELVDAVTKENK